MQPFVQELWQYAYFEYTQMAPMVMSYFSAIIGCFILEFNAFFVCNGVYGTLTNAGFMVYTVLSINPRSRGTKFSLLVGGIC